MAQKNLILGIALLIGGFLLTILIVVLMFMAYFQGQFRFVTVVVGTAVALLLFVCPQLWFGVYFLRFENQQKS